MKKIYSLFILGLLLIGMSSNMWGQYNGTGVFKKIATLEEITDGYYVIAYGTTVALDNVHTGTIFPGTPITVTDNEILNPGANMVWNIQTDGSGKTIFNEVSSKYISYTGSSNNVQVVDAVSTNNQRWNITLSSGLFMFSNASVTNRALKYNTGSPRFACYSSGQQNLTLYKLTITTTEPAITLIGVTENAIDFGTPEIGSASVEKTFTLNGINLTSEVSLTLGGTNPTQFTVSPSAPLSPESGSINQVVTVNYIVSATTANHSATLTISGGGTETPQVINLSGATVAQQPHLSTTGITDNAINLGSILIGGTSIDKTFDVIGTNLSSDVTIAISGVDAGQFSTDRQSLTKESDGSLNKTVTVSYMPAAAKATHTATLTISGGGVATPIEIALTGKTTAPITVPNVIITEAYGGGGNSGTIYKNDFIELFNTTADEVDISGWSVQYHSATGVGLLTNIFVLPANSKIPAGKFFLIQGAAGSGGTTDLPTPDAVSTINMSGTAGKVILYTTENAQTITSDISSIVDNEHFKDYLPYGTSAIPVWGSTTKSVSNANSASCKKNALRAYSGIFVYTQNIGNDYEVITPNPQNSNAGVTSLNNENADETIIYATNGVITVKGIDPTTVYVYSATGKQVATKEIVNGKALFALSKGMYVVKVGDKTKKVVL